MRLARLLGHQSRVIPAIYLVGISLGTFLLMLPVATNSRESASLINAAFTATSAICITGLTTVDTQTYWSPFGQVVIMVLIQIGGFGIVTVASYLTLLATGRISLQGSMLASQELHQSNLHDILRVPARVAAVMFGAEAVTAAVLTLGFRPHTDDWGTAAWYGLFHAISSFNNAGFALFSDNLIGFVGDAGVIVPLCLATILGGIGFPVLFELFRPGRRPSRGEWSVQARLTLYGTAILLVAGFVAFAVFEWNNPDTLGAMPLGDRLLAAFAGTVFPRTSGFNSIDYGAASDSTLALTYALMFVGGGSAGTAGGIKVGTAGIVIATVLAELRGENQVTVAHRSIPLTVQRSALAIVALGGVAVAAASVFIVADSRFTLQDSLFEAISAFGTVGLSTGITPRLPAESLIVLMFLMYLGRVGIVSVATALAVRARHRRYRLPEEQPIVG